MDLLNAASGTETYLSPLAQVSAIEKAEIMSVILTLENEGGLKLLSKPQHVTTKMICMWQFLGIRSEVRYPRLGCRKDGAFLLLHWTGYI